MKNIPLALLILIPALVLAPLVKITKHLANQSLIANQHGSQAASNSLNSSRSDEVFNHLIQSADLTPLGSFAAANQGPYQITGYQHNSCEGTIAIMPLYRNAEGAAILKRLLKAKEIRSGVILSGKIYPSFPQLTFTILQIKQSFNRLTTHSQTQQPLLAFAESGRCKLAEKMINANFT